MANGILIYAEQRDGEFNNATWEAIAAGQALAAGLGLEARAVLIGSGLAEKAAKVAAKELVEIVTLEHDKLAAYTPDCYAAAMVEAIRQLDPEWVVFSH